MITAQRHRLCSASVAAAVLCCTVGLVLGACTPQAPGPTPLPSVVPTVVDDVSAAVCGMEPSSVQAVTGYPVVSVSSDLYGRAASTRGACRTKSDDEPNWDNTVLVTLDDSASEDCHVAGETLLGRTQVENVELFDDLDGGAWERDEAAGVRHGVSAVTFVSDLCVWVTVNEVVEGRDRVADAKALSQQIIATLDLGASEAGNPSPTPSTTGEDSTS